MLAAVVAMGEVRIFTAYNSHNYHRESESAKVTSISNTGVYHHMWRSTEEWSRVANVGPHLDLLSSGLKFAYWIARSELGTPNSFMSDMS